MESGKQAKLAKKAALTAQKSKKEKGAKNVPNMQNTLEFSYLKYICNMEPLKYRYLWFDGVQIVDFSITPEGTPEYAAWLSSLHPRTCLTVYWLADLRALPEPGLRIRDRALRFAAKANLLEAAMMRSNDRLATRTATLIDNGDLDIYVAWTLWLLYVESVPKRFVLPGGQERVLAHIRTKLNRPELTARETQRELQWQAERMLEACEEGGDGWEFGE